MKHSHASQLLYVPSQRHLPSLHQSSYPIVKPSSNQFSLFFFTVQFIVLFQFKQKSKMLHYHLLIKFYTKKAHIQPSQRYVKYLLPYSHSFISPLLSLYSLYLILLFSNPIVGNCLANTSTSSFNFFTAAGIGFPSARASLKSFNLGPYSFFNA